MTWPNEFSTASRFAAIGMIKTRDLKLSGFIQALSNTLTQGVLLFADYGYGQREYYHPERHQGTLTCFYQHQQHANPFLYLGKQDITAHVNFTEVVTNAVESDCSLLGYTNQSAFLLACGLIDLAEKTVKQEITEAWRVNQAIKYLTLPTEMGEYIKVMALSKQLTLPLLGFSLLDRRRDLII